MKTIEELLLEKEENPKESTQINNEISFMERNIYEKSQGTQNPFLLMADILKDSTKKISGFQLSFDQQPVYESMYNNKNILVAADTSFGKTWLAGLVFKSKIEELDKEDKMIYIHLVPENVLTIQGIIEIKKMIDNDEVNISDTISNDVKKQYIFCTPEMFFSQMDTFEKNISYINSIIFDEAHMMSENHIRAEFYQFILSRIIELKKQYDSNYNFWFLSAFISKDESFLKDIQFNYPIQQHFPTGFKSRYAIIANGKTFLPGHELNEEIKSNENGVTLRFFSTVDKARKEYEKLIINYKLIEKYSKKLHDNKEKDEIYLIINGLFKDYGITTDNYIDCYDLIYKITAGYAIYHSKIPPKIREAIIKLSKLGHIKEIYATSAIIGGVNLNIDNIFIDEAKINSVPFNKNTFFNLAGRTGRFHMNKPTQLGRVYFNESSVNNLWITKKQDTFKTRKKSKTTYKDANDIWFVKESLKAKKEYPEYSDFFFMDPRINPKTIFKIMEDKNEFIAAVEKLKLFIEKCLIEHKKIRFRDMGGKYDEWIDQKEALEIFNGVLKFYKENNLKKEWDFSNIQPHHSGKIKAIRLFIHRIFYWTEDSMFENYHWFLLNKKKTSTPSSDFEKQVSLYNKYSKYKISILIRHAIKVYEKLSHSEWNFDLIINNKILNKDLYENIKKQNLIDEYKKWISSNKKVVFKSKEEINNWINISLKKTIE